MYRMPTEWCVLPLENYLPKISLSKSTHSVTRVYKRKLLEQKTFLLDLVL